MRWLLAAALGIAVIGRAEAQPSAAPAPRVIAPCTLTTDGLVLNTPNDAILPAGMQVSQPLTPVEMLEPTANDVKGEPIASAPDGGLESIVCAKCEVRGLGASWSSYDYLLWWPKSQPVPAMVSGNRFAPPVLGAPGTHLLIGGRSLGSAEQSGGRFTLGHSLNTENTLGIEGTYFFLGTRTLTTTASTVDYPQLGQVGVPYVDAFTNQPAAVVLARPAASLARIDVSTTTRAQGAEFNVVSSLVDSEHVRLRGLVGYRFLQIHEGLRSESTFVDSPTMGIPTTLGQVADQFDAHNRFNGGQLGLALDLSRGPVFVEFAGKVALGSNFEVVRIEGQTNTLYGYQPLPYGDSAASGIFAEPTNIGRFTRSAFAVVPEALVKFGWKTSDHGRFFVGYNFLYLSDAIRPGDQIDTTINSSQIRALGAAHAMVIGPDRPLPAVNRTDFWMQGLVLGLEGRY